jgi:hypothetical protein
MRCAEYIGATRSLPQLFFRQLRNVGEVDLGIIAGSLALCKTRQNSLLSLIQRLAENSFGVHAY